MMTTWFARSLAVCTLALSRTGPLALLLALGVCQAEEAPAKSGTAATSREQRIEAALLDDTTIEFVETPLQDVLDFLKDLHAIEIQLDSKALEAASIGSDSPVTRNLKKISLAAALRQFLGHLGLTYVVRDEFLLITTPDAAREMVDVRVYKISDLAAGNEAVALAGTVLRALTGASPESPRPRPAPAQAGASGAPGSAATAGGSGTVLNQDMNLVSIEPFHDALIVRANYQGHKATERLLAELRSKVSKSAPTPTTPAPKALPQAPPKAAPRTR